MKSMLTKSLRLTCLLAGVLIISGLATGCRGSIRHKTPIHPNWNMDDQAYLRMQEPSEFFQDARGMREPVANTVAQGELRADKGWETGIENGQYLTQLPHRLQLDADLLKRGEERYHIYCTPCHGLTGNGEGAVPAYAGDVGYTWMVADLQEEKYDGYPVGRIYHVASEGSGTMRGYKAQIPQADRWAIAAWVKALQQTQTVVEAADNTDSDANDGDSEQGTTGADNNHTDPQDAEPSKNAGDASDDQEGR